MPKPLLGTSAAVSTRARPECRRRKALERAEGEARAGMGRAHDAQPEASAGTHRRRSARRRSAWRRRRAWRCARPPPRPRPAPAAATTLPTSSNGIDDLAIAGAAAEHAAERILDLALGSACDCAAAGWRRPSACPGVQMPHWAAPWRWKDSCSSLNMPPGAQPLDGRRHRGPRTWPSGTRQAQTCSPSSSTVQAPQSPALQPILVPVRPRSSRSTSEQAPGRGGLHGDAGAVQMETRSCRLSQSVSRARRSSTSAASRR